MSVSLWRWSEECEGKPCCGDCDECGEEEKMIPIKIKRREPVMKWLPVSESLPEEGKQVLVCDDGGFIYTAECETRSDGELQWYESVEYRRMDDVVAWMPLPEPYREGIDDV